MKYEAEFSSFWRLPSATKDSVSPWATTYGCLFLKVSRTTSVPFKDFLLVKSGSYGIIEVNCFENSRTSQLVTLVKNPPTNTGEMGRPLGQEDLLEEEMATHSNILAGKIPWTEEPGGCMGSQRVRHE